MASPCRRSGPTTASPSDCPRATRRSTGSRRCCSRTRTRSRIWSSGSWRTSALFASRFRENAARALLLPRRRPGTRTPLWQQRQRAADLLAVASRYGSFPILVETYRECLADVFDLPALREILAGVARREIAIHSVETVRASPFASSLLFDYVAAYMYDGDTPLAERRAGALTLDRDLLRELLGQEELRELLDPEALADLELSLQALVPRNGRRRRSIGVHDLLRRLGDLGDGEVAARTAGRSLVASAWLAGRWPPRGGRSRVRIAGEDRWIAVEDVARYRDALGVALPVGIPAAFLGPAHEALDGLAGALGPDPRAVPDAGAGARAGVCRSASSRMPWSGCWRPDAAARRVPAGRRGARVVRPGRPAAAAAPVAGPPAREVEPVEPAALARFLPAWHGVAAGRGRNCPAAVRGPAALERLAEVVDQLAGVPIPASVLERDVLPARIPGYQPRLLDELGALGEVAWVGRGAWVATTAESPCTGPGREVAPRPWRPADGWSAPTGQRHDRHPRALRRRGASFYRELFAAAAVARTARCSTRCGTWSGPAKSRTTRSRRCVRCAGSGPRAGEPAPAAGRLTALGPPEAAGRWSLVEVRRTATTTPTSAGDTPQSSARRSPAGAAWRPDPRGRRRRRHRRRLHRRLPGPSGDGGGRPDPARLLRRWPRRGAVRAAGRAGPAPGDRATRPTTRAEAGPTCWRRRTRRTRTERRCHGQGGARPIGGPCSEPPAPTSSSWTATQRCTWSEAVHAPDARSSR